MKISSTSIIFLVIIQFSIQSWSQNIVYPWRATAAIAKCGETFEIWFNASNGQTINAIQLQGPYNKVETTFSIQSGSWIYDVTSLNTYNTKIKVNIPKNTPADRYDIIINTTTGPETSLAAVKVIKDFKEEYYILHFSDIHAFQEKYPTTLNRLSTIIDIANIINPEIAFNTGDDLYRPNDDRMNQLFIGNKTNNTKGLNDLKAATFTVVGNHDTDFDNVPENGFYPEKSKWWNKWWGLQAYNFSYAKNRFLVINDAWIGFDPTQQITEATNWLKKESAGNLRVGAAHIKDDELLLLEKDVDFGLVLVGHNHYIANQNPRLFNNKKIQYIVNSVRDNMEFNLYQVNTKKGTYTPINGSTAQVSYVENPTDQNSPSLYKPKLTLTYANANQGANKTNTATIVNNFNFPIQEARVRFVMPLGSKYTVTKGKIEQSFNGTSVQIVDVNINLEPNSTTVLEIGSSKK